MSVEPWRRLALGLILAPALGVCAAAQGPPTDPVPRPGSLPPLGLSAQDKKLKADAAALAADRKAATDDSLTQERQKLRADLMAALKRLEAAQQPPPRPVTPVPLPAHKNKTDWPEGTKPIDALRRAMNLFRDNDFDAALTVFGQLLQDPGQLPREDRVFARYLAASCLRRLGRIGEAQVAYREAAELAEQDEFFAEAATVQLSLIRSGQELEAQLAQLRARPKQK